MTLDVSLLCESWARTMHSSIELEPLEFGQLLASSWVVSS